MAVLLFAPLTCVPRPSRPSGPLVVGPQAHHAYRQHARHWRFPHRVQAQGTFVAHTRAWDEFSGKIRFSLTDTALAVILEGPLGLPLGHQVIPLIRGSPALPETLPWGILWHWVRDPLRYPADTLWHGAHGPEWALRTPAGSLHLLALDTRRLRLYISLRREYRLMLDDFRPVHSFLWPFHVRYQGPEGALEITWTRVKIPE